ncbi:MAG TPA: immune inhibitor A domain-containing protein [Thermoanaerobaculia bacterium]
MKRLLCAVLAATLFATSAPTVAWAQSADEPAVLETEEDILGEPRSVVPSDDETAFAIRGGDNFKSPKAAERFQRRQEALDQKLRGKKSSGRVHEVAKGQFVELGLERTDRIFVVLVEFGEKAGFIVNPAPPAPQNTLSIVPGPAHNTLPQPDRANNNSDIWQADYNRAHFMDMYFNKMKEYYRVQSSGRYSFNGDVTEWVKVPFNGSRYGSNLMGDAGMWTLIADAVNIWTKQQLDSGKTLAEVTDYLKSFDQWDRYDYDADGNFDEADGYIDHFQIVHAGSGEEVGGGPLGSDAIWSHRWQAFYNRAGVDGPAFNKDGGIEFGGGWGANPTGSTVSSANAALSSANPTTAATVTYAHPVNKTGIWVGDYTVQPENGGLGVFAHEYGHDLGLPDHYDTNGGTNGTGYWTIMSSGSYLGEGHTDIGSRPGDFNAWDKLQLGWLNYDEAVHGVASTHKLGPAETNTKKAQAVVIPLPPEKNVYYMYDPTAGKLQYGTRAWWGGRTNNTTTSITRPLAVPAGASTLQMRLNYQIETNWDYAYVSISQDGGTTWANLAGTWPGGTNGANVALTTNTNPNGQNLGNGITGTTNNVWRLASFNTTAFAGKNVLLRIRYKTDPFDVQKGLLVDEISFPGFTDGAENGDNGWTVDGFKASDGVESSGAGHYYIAEFRQYRTYDTGLQTGPYTYGHLLSRSKWVTHFPYQDGLLVTYWDLGEANNNTSQHRGEGRILPIDAHPEPLRRTVPYDGQNWTFSPWSASIQAFDATFTLEPTDPVFLPFTGTLPPATGSPAGTPNRVVEFEIPYPSQQGVSVFNDLNSYWSAARPENSVIVPKTGTSIRIINTSAHNTFMQIEVLPVTQ